MVIKTPNGVTVRMMTSSIVKVSFIKAIMEINIAIKIILTTLLVLKVSQKVMKISSGGTVRMMTSLIVKVSLRKLCYGD